MLRVAPIAALFAFALAMQSPPAPFAPRMFTAGGHRMPYRLFIPDAAARRQPLPLVVWLHGASGLGTDNTAQISAGGNELGSGLWVRPDIQARFPAFVVAPQSPPNQAWGSTTSGRLTPYGQLVIDLIDALAREFAIDRDRVYVIGQSRGGIGVWDLITKRPDVFAAAVPLCAVGDPRHIGVAADVGVWVFHGARDTGMPVDNARAMVAALKAAGGHVKYTEYPDVAHDVWTRAFAEPDLPAWLFAQRRPPGDCPGLCR
jgi:predicted peptidase